MGPARDRARAEAFAATHGVERVAGSYAELIADPEVEVVYNPLANGLNSWTPGNSVNCGTWKRWWPCPPRRTTTCAGNFRWRAGR